MPVRVVMEIRESQRHLALDTSSAASEGLTTRIARIDIWQSLAAIVSAELGILLGTSLQTGPVEVRPLVHTSVIPLTLVTDHLLLQLGIGVDEATRSRLQSVLLGGDTTPEAILDALREMANTAGGAIRRAALDSGMSFTIGLPSNDNLFDSIEGKRMAWTLTDADGMTVECVVTITPNRASQMTARNLREGMVLARDIRDASGAIVAAAGTALTTTAVDRIAAAVGEATVVEISLRPAA